MATVNSKAIVDKLIASSGYDPSWEESDLNPPDPRVVKIVEYTTPEGSPAWGLVYERDDPDRYHASNYVRNPRVIWRAEHATH